MGHEETLRGDGLERDAPRAWRGVRFDDVVPSDNLPIGRWKRPEDALHPFLLNYLDPAIERQFQVDYSTQCVFIHRLWIGVAIVLYGSYAVFDGYAASGQIYQFILTVRVGVVLILLSILATTWSWLWPRFGPRLLTLGLVACAGGALLMLSVSDFKASQGYFAALNVIIIYGAIAIRVAWRETALVGVVIITGYFVVSDGVNAETFRNTPHNDFLLIVNIVVCCIAAYLQESGIRKNYITMSMLRAAKREADRHLAAALEAGRAKSEFLAVISHELRTPLNALIGFSEMIGHEILGPLGDERYQAYARDIQDSGRLILNIIDDVLELSKAEAGRLTVVDGPVDPRRLLDSCRYLFQERAASRQITLVLDPPATAFCLIGDERLLRQLLLNLVSNALKFTREGGTVRVIIDMDGDGHPSVTVADTGVGINRDDLERVWEPFMQAAGGDGQRRSGTGLGLALVRRIADLHQGICRIDSVVGVGTTVTIEFSAERAVLTHPESLGITAASPSPD